MYRVGFSKDMHLFNKGNHIMLGGVKIPTEFGIVAYSDGDVLLHSLCEALYGAMGMGDLGTYFSPKSLPRGFSSQLIVDDVISNLKANNYLISNIDVLIVLDKLYLADFKEKIKAEVCKKFLLNQDQVAIKATNTDEVENYRISVYSNVLIYKGDKM